MPEERTLSWERKDASSSTLDRMSEMRSSMTLRAMERLTLVIVAPSRLREALMTGTLGVPSRSRIAARSAGTVLNSRSRISSNSSGSGRWLTRALVAWVRMLRTRFWRCSSVGSIEGLVATSESSRAEKIRVPSGSKSSSVSRASFRE